MIRPIRTFSILCFTGALTVVLLAQQPPQRRPAGGFVPGQQRAPEDPAAVERGKSLYGLSCRGCHGADLRGGDMGGPNLLRSQLSLADKAGEKIVPVIQNGQGGMPAIPLQPADAQAVASYIRSVMGTIGGQGKPPSEKEPPSILVGNAADGKVYFDTKCAGCHSTAGDLRGIASRITDPKLLQNAWVSGGRAIRRGPGGGGPANPNAKPVTVKVTPSGGGAPVEGRLVRIDDFTVTLVLADGSQRTFSREGSAAPKVEVNDPLEAHRMLLPQYSDKNMHDVTAFLVTLK